VRAWRCLGCLCEPSGRLGPSRSDPIGGDSHQPAS
jgi:hypothetical protein